MGAVCVWSWAQGVVHSGEAHLQHPDLTLGWWCELQEHSQGPVHGSNHLTVSIPPPQLYCSSPHYHPTPPHSPHPTPPHSPNRHSVCSP